MTKKAINCVWTYDADTRVSTCVHPDGYIISYDMNEITDPKVIDFIFQYGHKQFIQDKSAGIGAGATGEMKSAVWNERHEMLVSGQVYKTGGKAGERVNVKIVHKKYADMTPEKQEEALALMTQLGIPLPK